jgi:hypothetical protein
MTHDWWTPREVLTAIIGFFALCVVLDTINTLLGKLASRWVASPRRRTVPNR